MQNQWSLEGLGRRGLDAALSPGGGCEPALSAPCRTLPPSFSWGQAAQLPNPPENCPLCPSHPSFSNFLLLHISPANSSFPPAGCPLQVHGSMRPAGGGASTCPPSHGPLRLCSFPCYRCEEHPCPQGAVGSTLEQHKQLSLRCIQAAVPPCPRVPPAIRATGAWPRMCTATPLTYTLRNGLKIPASHSSARVFLLALLGEFRFPRAQMLQPRWCLAQGAGMAQRWRGGGHGILHPSPLLSCSPAAWPPAWEGQRGAGGGPAT